MYMPYPQQRPNLPQSYRVGDKLRFKGKTHSILKENEIVSVSFVGANNYYQVHSLSTPNSIIVSHFVLEPITKC